MPIRPKVEGADEWLEFLQKLIAGDHAQIVEILGSPAELIRVILRDADDRAAAQLAFETSLEKIAAMWQPQSAKDLVHYVNILKLFAAFTPPSGLSKIITQFELVGSWPLAERQILPNSHLHASFRTDSAREDIVEMQAFLALEQYFPTVPVHEGPLFASYRALLFAKIQGPHWTHCLRRLLELSAISPNETVFVQNLSRSPRELLVEIVPVIVNTRRAIRDALISSLFSQILLKGLRAQFLEVLAHFNCQLLNDEQFPLLRTPFEEITIMLDRRSPEFAVYASSRKPSLKVAKEILMKVGAS